MTTAGTASASIRKRDSPGVSATGPMPVSAAAARSRATSASSVRMRSRSGDGSALPSGDRSTRPFLSSRQRDPQFSPRGRG